MGIILPAVVRTGSLHVPTKQMSTNEGYRCLSILPDYLGEPVQISRHVHHENIIPRVFN